MVLGHRRTEQEKGSSEIRIYWCWIDEERERERERDKGKEGKRLELSNPLLHCIYRGIRRNGWRRRAAPERFKGTV
jgi:hypothetical protein